MRLIRAGLSVAFAVCVVGLASPAGVGADDPDVTGDDDLIENPEVVVDGDTTIDGGTDGEADPDGTVDVDTDDSGPAMDYQWLPACGINRPGETPATCPGMYTCESDNATKWTLWARELPGGEWYIVGSACYSGRPPGPGGGDVRPQVTDAIVLREVKRIGLPEASIQVQPPDGATLVNFETIFYTERPEFARTVQLLGYTVDIEATATTYTWHHGDGSSQSSDGPGAPYPAKNIVHLYSDAHVTVRPSVDVTYEVRWRADGADWHTLDDPLTAAGASVALEVKEATALLTDPYR